MESVMSEVNLDLIAQRVSGLDLTLLNEVRRIIDTPQFENIHDSKFHIYRYTLSIQYLMDIFKNKRIRVLEIGEPGPFTSVMTEKFPKWEIFHQVEDLRSGLKFDDSFFDLVVSMEVIEHIADNDIGHEITSQGVTTHINDLYRVTKPKGAVFVTTPNASSIWNIKRILMQEPPLIYEKHYREFSHNELNDLFRNAKFEITKHSSIVAWNFWDFSDIEKFMKEHNYSLVNRGDDQFLLASK